MALATAIGLVTTAIFKQNQERKKNKKLIEEGNQEAIKAEITRLQIAVTIEKKNKKEVLLLFNEQIRAILRNDKRRVKEKD